MFGLIGLVWLFGLFRVLQVIRVIIRSIRLIRVTWLIRVDLLFEPFSLQFVFESALNIILLRRIIILFAVIYVHTHTCCIVLHLFL